MQGDPATNRRSTILLTEDDPLLVKMYRDKFQTEGFNLVSAEDGEKGLEIALGGGIDILVLDILMPKLSGIDVLKQLRSTPKGKDLPVIVLTNLTDKEEIEKARKYNIKEYLTKANLTPGQLVDVVKKYL